MLQELEAMLKVCKEVNYVAKKQKETYEIEEALYKKKQDELTQLQMEEADLEAKMEQQKDEISSLIWQYYEQS